MIIENKNAQILMRHIEQTCKKNGVRFRPVDDDHVIMQGRSIRCQGYFSAPLNHQPLLTFATKMPFETWFRIAIHEFSHMEQWLEETEEVSPEIYSQFWNWLEYKIELTPAQVHAIVLMIRQRELDAERRTLETIKKYQLPLDTHFVAKDMNWYLYSYQYAQQFREWLPNKDRSYDAERAIVSVMPDTLNNDYDTIHQEFLHLFAETYQPLNSKITRNRAYSNI